MSIYQKDMAIVHKPFTSGSTRPTYYVWMLFHLSPIASLSLDIENGHKKTFRISSARWLHELPVINEFMVEINGTSEHLQNL